MSGGTRRVGKTNVLLSGLAVAVIGAYVGMYDNGNAVRDIVRGAAHSVRGVTRELYDRAVAYHSADLAHSGGSEGPEAYRQQRGPQP